MAKLLSILALALAIGQATGLTSYLIEAACERECPSGADGRTCLPDCPDCACCRTVRVVVAPPLERPDPVAAIQAVSMRTADAPPSPDPEEILHVPIRLLV